MSRAGTTIKSNVFLMDLDMADAVDALADRLEHVSVEYPSLARYLGQLLDHLADGKVSLDDINSAMRLYQQSPIVFELVADISSIIYGGQGTERSELARSMADEDPAEPVRPDAEVREPAVAHDEQE